MSETETNNIVPFPDPEDEVPFGDDRELPEKPLIVPSPDDPMAIARAFLDARYRRTTIFFSVITVVHSIAGRA
jgi:hypothetical protein